MTAPADVLIAEHILEALYKTRRAGERTADGTIYAGVSPDTGRDMYTTEQDAPGAYTAGQAIGHAQTFGGHGRKDWRQPSRGELKVLFENSAAIGGFDRSGARPGSIYRSSTAETSFSSWCRAFDDGRELQQGDQIKAALRLVCG